MKASAISLVCFVASLLPAWFAVKRVQLARCMRAWFATQGKIINASVEPVATGDGYRVKMRYEYEVSGKKYDSGQTDPGLLSSRHINGKHFQTELGANAYASEVLAAPEVQVWFDPTAPSQSMLDRSFPLLFIAILVFSSAALVAVGVVFIQ